VPNCASPRPLVSVPHKIRLRPWPIFCLIIVLFLTWLAGRVSSAIICTEEGYVSAQIRFVVDALNEFARVEGRYPSQQEGLAVLVEREFVADRARIDFWGNAFIYECRSADCSKIVIRSKGSNRVDERGWGDDVSGESTLALSK
jgi:hypothetical protein